LAVGVFTAHPSYDLESFRIVGATLRTHPSQVYDTKRWPYPPGFFPWILLAYRVSLSRLAQLPGVSLSLLLRLPIIAADACLAWVVARFLGARGASERLCLAAAAAIALGPAFAAIAGYESQIDAMAILPAAVALLIWQERPQWRWRALAVGLLLGLGCALKTVPIVLVPAFLPSLKGWRQRIELVAAAAAVPALAILPWFLKAPRSTLRIAHYAGIPGIGGLSLLVEPKLVTSWLVNNQLPSHYSRATLFLIAHDSLVVVPVLLVITLLLFRYSVEAPLACVIIWLGVYAAMPNFFFQYLVWGLPFFLMAGYIWQTMAFEAVVFVPEFIFLHRPWHHHYVVSIYVPMMIVLWVVCVGALAVTTWGAVSRARERRRRVSEPNTRQPPAEILTR
jgi:hypothetical protein